MPKKNAQEVSAYAEGDIPGFRLTRQHLTKDSKNIVIQKREENLEGMFTDMPNDSGKYHDDTVKILEMIMKNVEPAFKTTVEEFGGGNTVASAGVWTGVYGVDCSDELHVIRETSAGGGANEMWHKVAQGKAIALKELMWQGKTELSLTRFNTRGDKWVALKTALTDALPNMFLFLCCRRRTRAHFAG